MTELTADQLKAAMKKGKIAPQLPHADHACYVISLPPSTNSLFATVKGRRVKSRDYRVWIESASTDILVQGPRRVPAPVRVTMHLSGVVHPRRDLDNFAKPVLDLLVSAGVLEDDSLPYLHALELLFHATDEQARLCVDVWRVMGA